MGICHSYTPDGRCVSLLKILLTNFCTYDCVFCVNRVSSDIRRARFTPEEVVNLTLDFYKRNYIEGLFLSSGIIQSPDYTMEQLIAVAKTLRTGPQVRRLHPPQDHPRLRLNASSTKPASTPTASPPTSNSPRSRTSSSSPPKRSPPSSNPR